MLFYNRSGPNLPTLALKEVVLTVKMMTCYYFLPLFSVFYNVLFFFFGFSVPSFFFFHYHCHFHFHFHFFFFFQGEAGTLWFLLHSCFLLFTSSVTLYL